MKNAHLLLHVATLALATSVSAQTITGYGVARYHDVTQTTSSAPVGWSSTPYMLSGYVFGSGLVSSYQITFSGGSVTSPVAMSFTSSNAEFQSIGYMDLTDLNGAYGSGSFGMNLTTGSGLQSFSLPSLPAGGFPELPQITNGSWISGQMQIDATQNYTINFASFSSFNSDDSYKLSIRNGSDVEVAGDFWNAAGNTSYLVNSGALTAGQTYYASLQFNNNSIDYGIALPGANGNVGYSTINEFEILAIPEPSTYATIFGVLALAGTRFARRRRTI